jgi:hypothetical protein
MVYRCASVYHMGSVLGPINFTSCDAELETVAAMFGVRIHLYADDSRLLMHCEPSSVGPAVVSSS